MLDIKDFYLNKGYNCAETILQAANLDFNLELEIKTIKLMSGFGGGMFEEDLCGVVSGGIASLSLIFSRPEDKEKLLKPAVIEFKQEIFQSFSNLNCRCIKPIFRDESEKCLNVIISAYKTLKKVIEKYKEKR